MLSLAQEEILNLVNEGVNNVQDLSEKLRKPENIIRAQLTRIKNAGHNIKVEEKIDSIECGRPRSSGRSSNEHITKIAEDAGNAKYTLDHEQVREFMAQHKSDVDVHPMVLLGVTIQFVKLCGGRLSAHQTIEQVYSALRAMVGDGSPSIAQEQWSAPWPLNSVELENQELKKRIAELERKVKKRG